MDRTKLPICQTGNLTFLNLIIFPVTAFRNAASILVLISGQKQPSKDEELGPGPVMIFSLLCQPLIKLVIPRNSVTIQKLNCGGDSI
jgi:hypothetical protein